MTAARLRIEFAPGAMRTGGRTWALLLVGTICLALALDEAARLEAARAHAETLLAQLGDHHEADATSTPVKTRPDAQQLALARDARRVSRDLLTPWASLLNSLASASTPDVALLSVEPSVSRRALRLTLEARDPHAMLAYVSALQHEPRLNSVLLVSHQLQAQAPGTPIRFQVQANWGEAS